MKKEIYEFICPVYFLDYIFNAEIEGVNEKEINKIESVLSGYSSFSIKEESPFFTYRNDFNNLGGECITLMALKTERPRVKSNRTTIK